jgi:hypothetical protein
MSAHTAVALAFIPTHQAEPDFKAQECLGTAIVVDDNPDITDMLAAVEYALRETNKPIGVAAYRAVSTLPTELRDRLPAPEQVAKLLEGIK